MDAFFTSFGLLGLITPTFLEIVLDCGEPGLAAAACGNEDFAFGDNQAEFLANEPLGAEESRTAVRRARKMGRMTGTASTRVLAFILLGTCSAVCQHLDDKENSLPDAPNAQTVNRTERLRSFIDTAHQPVSTPALASFVSDPNVTPKYDPLHFENKTKSGQQDATDPNAWIASLLKRNTAFHASSRTSLVGRATDAALSVIVTRDESGQRKLNTPYLLRVLTVATAHAAQRPYWRRSVGQPFSDFGSTVGNDAGMNLLHEFQPGLMELVKSHEPKFVSNAFARSGSRAVSRPGRSSSLPSHSELHK